MNSFSRFGVYFTYKDEISRTISWGHWFAFLNIFLCIILGSAYILYSPSVEYTSLGNFYLIVSWLGHFSCLVFILYMLLFFPLSFIGSLRIFRIYAILMAVVLFSVLLIDIKIYQQIKIHLSFSVLGLFFEQEGFSTGINFNFLYIAIPILVLVECYFSHLAWKHIYIHNYKKTTNVLVAVFMLCFLSTHVLNIWANAYKYPPITQQKTLFPAYYPMTANTFLAEHGWIIEKNDTQTQKFKPAHYPLEVIDFKPVEKYKNVLLILINGLTFENAFTNNKELMPYLNDFAKNNSMFTNHYLGVTSFKDGAFELGYGLPAQYLSSIELSRYTPVILSEMRLQDYKIHAFISDPSGKLKVKNNSIPGFRNNALSIYKSDKDTVLATISDIKSWAERPRFNIVSLNELYSNDKCADYTSKTKDNKSNFYKCLQSADQRIMEIANSVTETKNLDDTLIILTSVKAVNKNNYLRRNFHVPLIIHWPLKEAPSVSNMLTGTQDIAPTIAHEILGITNETDSFSTGTNLKNPTSRPWILSGDERAIHIITPTQTTIYDRQGNANLYADIPGSSQAPNITTLIKAMKIMNKFNEK